MAVNACGCKPGVASLRVNARSRVLLAAAALLMLVYVRESPWLAS